MPAGKHDYNLKIACCGLKKAGKKVFNNQAQVKSPTAVN
jgi:hypothetical protein